jgi:transcriptional regulator of arginine metabolism
MQGRTIMRKSERHQIIKKIILDSTIQTQEELLTELKKQGVTATQATISRDIRDLKIVKKADKTGQVRFELFKETTPTEEQTDHNELFRQINEFVKKVDTAQFLTIVHTLPNNAQLLAASLDDYPLSGKVATIAGFDTIVIITKSNEDAEAIANFFKAQLFL